MMEIMLNIIASIIGEFSLASEVTQATEDRNRPLFE
jgi:hypothetical protein